MVSFPRHLTVCITYQPPLVISDILYQSFPSTPFLLHYSLDEMLIASLNEQISTRKLHRSYVFVAVGCDVAAQSALVFAVTTCQSARCYNAESQLCLSPVMLVLLRPIHI
jgi:hypothetical protein